VPESPIIVLPKQIKVGGLTYQVVTWHPSGAQAARRFGECSHLELTIRVDDVHGAERTREVFLHELLHAIGHVFGPDHLPQDLDQSKEVYVGATAMGLTAVLADNPELVRFIRDAWPPVPA